MASRRIITTSFTDHILAMLGKWKKEEVENLLDEWDRYFSSMKLYSEDKQLEEFSNIMKARLQSGVISLRAPDLEKELGWR